MPFYFSPNQKLIKFPTQAVNEIFLKMKACFSTITLASSQI